MYPIRYIAVAWLQQRHLLVNMHGARLSTFQTPMPLCSVVLVQHSMFKFSHSSDIDQFLLLTGSWRWTIIIWYNDRMSVAYIMSYMYTPPPPPPN